MPLDVLNVLDVLGKIVLENPLHDGAKKMLSY